MPYVRTFAAACAAMLLNASAVAEEGRDSADPGIFAKLQAVQAYIKDGSATLVAQACAESVPDFMSDFLPRFIGWRSANSKQIALGAALATQFKDSSGQPMDPSAVGRAVAEKVRAMGQDERQRECSNLLRDVAQPV